eukprot:gene11830-13791_t
MRKKIVFLVLSFVGTFCFGQQSLYLQQLKLAGHFTKSGDHKNAALAYTRALKLTEEMDANDQYNAACSWSLAGRPDSAFYFLEQIAGKSYFDLEHLIKDKDLELLHRDHRWGTLVNRIKNVKLYRMKSEALYQDFDLMVSALKEAHTGLYWYNTKPAFDSICVQQRAKIESGMTALDFYNVLAPVVAFTKEGHSFLRLDKRSQAYLKFKGSFFPFYIKILDHKVYLINDLGNLKTRGKLLSKVNGNSIESIMEKFLSYEPSDGFNTTSKYRWIEEEAKFNIYYSRAYPQTAYFDIEVTDPLNGQTSTYKNIPAVGSKEFNDNYKKVGSAIQGTFYTAPIILKTDSIPNTALLTINSFSEKKYKTAKINFKQFIKEAFEQIDKKNLQNLILDIRNNGGGSEGYEEYVMSYLIEKDYKKYDYVQASAFSYSFYANSDYKYEYQTLDSIMVAEHYRANDGRLLRKEGVLPHYGPRDKAFKGKIFVLTTGLTYSGGAEFATLLKNYTNAVFIGEETGGGYYGNTSGIRITLKLPASKLEIGIPLLKFAVHTENQSQAFGRGLIPDYKIEPTIVEYLSGFDPLMQKALDLVR